VQIAEIDVLSIHVVLIEQRDIGVVQQPCARATLLKAQYSFAPQVTASSVFEKEKKRY
jgi:hypothetical protein